MFLLLICAVFSKKSGYFVYPQKGLVILPFRYGFYSGGTYTINVTEGNTDGLVFVIATYENTIKFLSGASDYAPCNYSYPVDYTNVISLQDGKGIISGKIDKKGMYYTTVASCNPYDNGYTFYFTYLNPNSCLSSDEQPCLITVPVIAGIAGLLFIIWLINWFMYFSLKNSLHLYFTIGILLTVTYEVLYVFEYISRNKTDKKSNLYVARKVFRVLQETVLLSAMFLSCRGWCIIHSSVHWGWVVLAFVLSAGITVPYSISDYANLSVIPSLIVLLTAAAFAGVFLYFMLRGIAEANETVKAHLYVIAENGIDPKTTPIYKKHILFSTVCGAVIAYFLVLIFRSAFNSIWTLPIFVMQLIYDIIIVILITIIAFAFRMKKETLNGYMMIGDDGEGEMLEKSQFEAFDIEHLDHNTVPYESGMTLPPQPTVNKPKSKEKNLRNEDNEAEQRTQELLPNNESEL